MKSLNQNKNACANVLLLNNALFHKTGIHLGYHLSNMNCNTSCKNIFELDQQEKIWIINNGTITIIINLDQQDSDCFNNKKSRSTRINRSLQ